MKRILPVLALVVVLSCACAGQTAQPVSEPDIHLTADDVMYVIGTEQFSAAGNALLQRGDVSMRADKITGDYGTGDVQAVGNVRFTSPSRSLTGSSFTYNFRTEQGVARDAAASVDHLYFRGKELVAEPGRYVLRQTRFTGCSEENPHYYLIARELTIEPGKQLVARDVSFYIFGKRLFTVKTYRDNLQPGRHGSTGLPNVGYSRLQGLYAGYEFALPSNDRNVGSLDLRVASRRGLIVGARYDRVAGQPIFARLTYHEPSEGIGRADTLVSRLPEIGIRYYTDPAQRNRPVPRSALDLSRDYFNPVVTETAGRVSAVGEMSVGEFVEDPGHTSSARADLRGILLLNNTPLGAGVVLSPAVLGRVSQYSHGDTYGVMGVRLAAGRSFGERTYASLAYMTHATTGSSPFFFDQVELRTELAGRLSLGLGQWTFAANTRYDLRNSRVFDQEYSVSKIFHCVEPTIKYRQRTREFSVGIGLVGL